MLRCRVGLHPFTRVLVGSFLWLAALIALSGVASALRALAGGSPVRLGMLGRCLPLAFGLGTWFHGRHLARGEDQFLVTFAAEAIGGDVRELEQESLFAALWPWRFSAQLRPNGERSDGQPEWVPSFPVVLMVGAVAAVFITCAGLPVLMALFG